MSRRNFNCVQPLGLVTTVCAISALIITAGLQWTPVPANATERGEERRDARILGRPAVTKQGSRRPNAKRQMIKAVRNVGGKSEILSRMRANPPGT